MRDAYVGNLGDFAKYSLLRALTGRPDRPEDALPLHVVWFRVFDDMGPVPSKDRGWSYLDDGLRVRACDPGLFECLKQFGRPEERSLDRVQCSGILPHGTHYHSERVPDSHHPSDRHAARRVWTSRMVSEVASQPCRIVFLDPDVGLAPASQENRASPRHVYPSEVNQLLERMDSGGTLVVFQSLVRDPRGTRLHSWTDANWYESERPTVVEFKPPHWKKAQHAFVIFRPEAVQERLDGLTRRFWPKAADPSVSLMSASPDTRPETVRVAPAAGPGRRPHRSTQLQRPNPQEETMIDASARPARSLKQAISRRLPKRRDDSGLTTLEWLLIVAAVAGLAALAVVLVTNVVSDTSEQIAGNSARKTAAQLAATEVMRDAARDSASQPSGAKTFGDWVDHYTTKCERFRITYSDIPGINVLPYFSHTEAQLSATSSVSAASIMTRTVTEAATATVASTQAAAQCLIP